VAVDKSSAIVAGALIRRSTLLRNEKALSVQNTKRAKEHYEIEA
jgi:hypothetical protein